MSTDETLPPGPYRGGKVHVLAERCATCIFRPGNLMDLEPGRVTQMVADAKANEAAITCHETLPYWPGTADPAVCRGYFDRYGADVYTLRLAIGLGIVVEDQPPTAQQSLL